MTRKAGSSEERFGWESVAVLLGSEGLDVECSRGEDDVLFLPATGGSRTGWLRWLPRELEGLLRRARELCGRLFGEVGRVASTTGLDDERERSSDIETGRCALGTRCWQAEGSGGPPGATRTRAQANCRDMWSKSCMAANA